MHVFLGTDDLAKSAATLVRLMVLFVGGYVVTTVIEGVARSLGRNDVLFGEIIRLIVVLVTFVLGLVCFARFTGLVHRTAKRIRQLDTGLYSIGA